MTSTECEIADLNQKLETIDNPREGYLLVHEHISQCHAGGHPVPEDLVLLERQLIQDCLAESQGR